MNKSEIMTKQCVVCFEEEKQFISREKYRLTFNCDCSVDDCCFSCVTKLETCLYCRKVSIYHQIKARVESTREMIRLFRYFENIQNR